MNIRDVALRRIIDSRGNPTIEAEIRTKTGFGRAAAPAGASTGTHEAMAWPEGSVAKGMKIAEEKAKDYEKIRVTHGPGTRLYYEKLGYNLEEHYMVKKLK